ncbi:hypothetical protein C0J52_10175 [Blattella germanica]|nr:hypothetical protein C0J52_10175 [Blattella germanica]
MPLQAKIILNYVHYVVNDLNHVRKVHDEAYMKKLSRKHECPIENTKDTEKDSPSSIHPITVADILSPANQQILQFEKALEGRILSSDLNRFENIAVEIIEYLSKAIESLPWPNIRLHVTIMQENSAKQFMELDTPIRKILHIHPSGNGRIINNFTVTDFFFSNY